MADFNRLTVLRDFLLGVDPKRFTMTSFFEGYHSAALDNVFEGYVSDALDNLPPPATCGTAACMAGWACFIPEFKQAGLHATAAYVGARTLVPTYDGDDSFDALKSFFSITGREALYLFDNGARYSIDDTLPDDRADWTPEDGAKHLTSFIERHDDVMQFLADDVVY